MHISEIKVREAIDHESTVSHAGDGTDPNKCIKISMAPGTRLTGCQVFGMTFTKGFKDSTITDTDILVSNSQKTVKNILDKAGLLSSCVCRVQEERRRY